MELKINCNQSIQLDKFISIDAINSEVSFYELKNDTLSGDVKLYGEYIKQIKDEKQKKGFEEIVPFTVVFRTNNFIIDNIIIENFSYNVIENQGIDCQFNIMIYYHLDDKNEEILNDDIYNTKDKDNQNDKINDKTIDINDDNSIEIPVETDEEIISVTNDKLEQEANEITKEYEDVLEEILLNRNDNFLEENDLSNNDNKYNVDIIQCDKKEKVVIHFKENQYQKISVFYPSKDSDIEEISKNNHYPVDKIYRENSDYAQTRRIILK